MTRLGSLLWRRLPRKIRWLWWGHATWAGWPLPRTVMGLSAPVTPSCRLMHKLAPTDEAPAMQETPSRVASKGLGLRRLRTPAAIPLDLAVLPY